jgi:hypothetical protein
MILLSSLLLLVAGALLLASF